MIKCIGSVTKACPILKHSRLESDGRCQGQSANSFFDFDCADFLVGIRSATELSGDSITALINEVLLPRPIK